MDFTKWPDRTETEMLARRLSSVPAHNFGARLLSSLERRASVHLMKDSPSFGDKRGQVVYPIFLHDP
jgi:hypothetical protein